MLHVKGNFLDFRFFPLDTDNFAARHPLTWRWREETRVIPYASEPDTAAQPQAGQHVGPTQSSPACDVSVVFETAREASTIAWQGECNSYNTQGNL